MGKARANCSAEVVLETPCNGPNAGGAGFEAVWARVRARARRVRVSRGGLTVVLMAGHGWQ